MKKRPMQKTSNSIAWRKFTGHFVAFFLALLTTSPSWAKLTATADRTLLDSNETLQLTVRFDAQVLSSEPNFDVLQRDFKILSNNRQQQYSMINGRTESYTDWKLTLQPKRIGRLLIPSIKFKKDISDAVEITVRKASPSNATGQPVYTETLIDKSAVYLQEQLLLTHRLYTSIQLTDLSIEELVIPGAIVQKSGQNQFRKRIGNRDYIVVEMAYAVFPQTSGKLDIPAIGISAYQVGNNSQNSFFRSRGNQLIRNTQSKIIDVMAKPAHIDADQWMPSSQLQLNQQWSSSLDQLVVGEPITRTITISAKGLTGSQILPLSLKPSGDYKVYPDQAQLDEQVGSDGVTGIRRESLALVPNRQGEIVLPEISVRWWDTVNQRMQTATLEAIRLDVGPAPSDSTSNTDSYLAPIDMADSDQNPSAQQNSVDQQSLLDNAGPSWLIQLSLALNALLLTLVVALLLKRSKQADADRAKSQLSSQSDNPRLKLKQRLKAIEIAAGKGDLAAVREGILVWARGAFPNEKVKTVDEIALLCADVELTEQLRLLDQSLYNRQSSEKADLKLLIRRLKTLDIPVSESKTSTNGLKPLYPTNNIG
jgi:hypothetical protein